MSEGLTEQTLPAGWRWVKLEDLVDPFNGYWGEDAPFDMSTEMTVLGVGNITNNGYIRLKGATIRHFSLQDMEAVASEGDLLVVKSSGSAANIRSGKTGICSPELDGKIAYSNFMIRLSSRRSIVDPYLLWHILNSDIAKEFIKKIVGGSTYPNIKWSTYKDFTFPLPALPEQKRIAAILTEQMAAVEKARAAAEARLKAAKELPASYLREVFKSEKTQGWHTMALGDAGEVVSGVTLGSKIKKVKVRAVPYLRVANVKDGHLDLNDVKTIEVTENEIQRWRLQAGDLLLTEGGDPDKLGRGSFWNDEIPECIHQNHIFRVRFPQDRFLPEFLSAQMSSEYGKSYFLAHAKQTTGIATINQKVLKAFPLLVPPIKEQMEIAEAISSKISTANQICTMLFEELTTINKLPAALLRQAFAGEL